jgi:hypothetical protein
MPGGLLQLSVWGAESELLMGNPEMSLFETAFTRHTNFAMEPIEVAIDGTEVLTDQSPLVLKCKIPRHADLLTHIYLQVDIPDIYSGYHVSSADERLLQEASVQIEIAERRKEAASKSVTDLESTVQTAEDALELQQSQLIHANAEMSEVVASILETMNITPASVDEIQAARQAVAIEKATLQTLQNELAALQAELSAAKTSQESIETTANISIALAEETKAGVAKRKGSRSYKFAWINEFGSTLIKRAELSIGGNVIETFHENWIALWHKVFGGFENDRFDSMTGNTGDMTDPAGAYSGGAAYPTSTLDPALNVDPEATAAESAEWISNPYLRPPSVRGRTLHIPLPFWFTRSIGHAIPLVALQYHDVELRIELRPLNELYTVNEAKNGAAFGSRVRPTDPDHFMQSFTTTKDARLFENGEFLGNVDAASQSINKLDLNPRLLANYIFLDEDERQSFASSEHEYLIELYDRHEFDGVVGGQHTFELDLKHPVKTLAWYAQRDDLMRSNVHSNYTNWAGGDPGSHGSRTGKYAEQQATLASGGEVLGAMDGIPTKFDFTKFNKPIIKDVTIRFNGIKRFDTRGEQYYNEVQHYQHPIGWEYGINVYTFALTPKGLQPSGTCNMSRVKKVQLDMETTPIEMEHDENETLVHKYKYIVTIYSQHFNILRIASGMAGLGFHK